MESQPQNPEFRIHPENFHPSTKDKRYSTSSELLKDTRKIIIISRTLVKSAYRKKKKNLIS